MDTKLTIRVPRRSLENAKRYAKSHNTSLTKLVSAYLEHLPDELKLLEQAPIVRRLSGILSDEVSLKDYKKYLEEKYGKK